MANISIKCILLAVLAIGFGTTMTVAHGPVLEDALLDRFDKATVAEVMDYFEDTRLSRAFGFALIFGFGLIAGIAVDRIVDHARPSLRNS
jgi:hypothetical protein